jgi:putative sigma-54 modulation protein
MGVVVTARHMNATPILQDYAQGKGEAIQTEFPHVEHVHIVLDHEKHLSMAEIVVQAKKHVKVEARHSAENMRAAIDECFLKAEKQLRRVAERIHNHKLAMKRVETERERGPSAS